MLVVLLAVIASIGTQTASAATVVVGTCVNGVHFSTINAAISAVPAGSVIRICPNTYQEQITIQKNLTLTGLSFETSDAVIIAVPSSPLPMNATSTISGTPIAANIAILGTPSTPITVNLNNLIVDSLNNGNGCPSRTGTNVVGILYQYAKGTANHVTTRNQVADTQVNGCQGGFGFYAEGPTSPPPGTPNLVTLEYSSIHDYNKNGVVGSGYVTLNVTHNVVTGAGPTDQIAQNGIEYYQGGGGKIFDNQVARDRYIGRDVSEPNSGSGIILYNAVAGTGSTPISNNSISDTDVGISLNFAGGPGSDDNYTVMGNSISRSTYEGIDVCSANSINITHNYIYNSGESAVDLDENSDDGCSPATTGSTVQTNTLVDACAGVLGNISGNTVGTQSYFDDVNTTLSGSNCPAVEAPLALVGGPVSSTGRRRSANP